MAQQVEHILGKDEVTGSNPVSSSSGNALKSRFCVVSGLFCFGLFFRIYMILYKSLWEVRKQACIIHQKIFILP